LLGASKVASELVPYIQAVKKRGENAVREGGMSPRNEYNRRKKK
jgi:hypothetical protein